MAAIKRVNWAAAPWLLLTATDLQTEYRQATEEGRDLSSLEAEFAALAELDLTEEAPQQRAEALLDAVQECPLVAGYPYEEPSDLAGIQAACVAAPALPGHTLSDAELQRKVLGAWLGRASGCLLGKPVEGRRSWQIEKYLKTQGRWPLADYFSLAASEEMARECGLYPPRRELFAEGITCMVEDDDTNYTVTGLAIIKQFGPGFTPESVARFWLDNIPLLHVCTAERVAYRNLTNSIPPPLSGSFRNVYREWIGAQIRADFFGYVSPGQPRQAAEFAWRDACISHVKNGIYGEMWVAAMLAAAYVCDDRETVIRAGLAQVPARCRLAAGVERMLDAYRAGQSVEQALADLRGRWDEDRAHDWCHTISNAEIVTLALLWGEGDYTRSLGLSVMPGFDTDCNGATVGSVLGLLLGAEALPRQWVEPLQDTLLTGVAGYHRVSLTALAQETVELIHRVAGG